MLLQIKIYLIAILYLFGALFMLFFPPRNFASTGGKVRTKRSTDVARPDYLSPSMLVAEVERLARDAPEAVTMVKLAPNTAENRTIVALELRSDCTSKKPAILILGGLNGMAWSIPRAIMELAERLLYDANYQTPYFNDYDWYLIPCGNPDGFHYTHSIRDLPALNVDEWSKNVTVRSITRPAEWHKNVDKETEQDTCIGTHINRNFAFHWQDDVHQTPERCSQFYPGARPFSTAEAQAIRHYVDELGETIQLVIHLHASFVPKKEFILFPWRYSLRQPSNFETLQIIGEYAARHARFQDGRLYEVHQSSSDGRVAGSFSDYMSGVVGTELVYIVKPYHERFPSFTAPPTDQYVSKAINTVLSIVRGWRSSNKLNTLSFFGRDVEF